MKKAAFEPKQGANAALCILLYYVVSACIILFQA